MGKAATWLKLRVVRGHHVYKEVWIQDSREGALSILNVSDAKNQWGLHGWARSDDTLWYMYMHTTTMYILLYTYMYIDMDRNNTISYMYMYM